MAQSTRDIRRRIRSITSTMQITKAMELVSSAKLTKSKERLIRTRPYYYTVLRNIRQTFSTIDERHPLLEEREVHKTLYIVISDDRGLAGGYNNNVVKLVEEDARGKEKDSFLILIGSKAIDYFNRTDFVIREKYVGITEEPKYSDAEKIGKVAYNLYANYIVDEIKVVYTRFINNITNEPTLTPLLPHGTFEEEGEKRKKIIDFEPSPEAVLDYLIPKYINSYVYGALIEAACSEQSARRIAMEIATDNAEELIEDLRIKYNRARQSAITTELTEIITSSEALDG